MFRQKFQNVCIESYAFDRAPITVTSAEMEDRIAPLYKKLSVPMGTLERLSGIKERRMYPAGTFPSTIATRAGQEALTRSGIDKKSIGAVINCSVTRDFFEPATAVLVHRNLGFSEDVIALDITNACIGFSNGINYAANLIESGVIKAALITSGENMGPITDSTMKKLCAENNFGRDELLRMMPSFTLGSGAVAMVLCHRDLSTQKHRIVAQAMKSASEGSEYCVGDGDYCFAQFNMGIIDPLMSTDSQKLIAAAAKLGGRLISETKDFFGWQPNEIDHIVCHQVGKQVNSAFYATLGLPYEKEHTVYQKYGNLVSSAMPCAFIETAEENKFMTGDKIMLLGYGSGLNGIFTAVVW